MNRSDLQRLSEERIADAKALLEAGKWAGAYYLAGYAVECALKACIAKETKAEDFPDQKAATKAWKHDITELVDAAGFTDDLQQAWKANKDLSANWQTAKDWKVESRYVLKGEVDAKALVDALTEPTNGVLQWIKLRW